MRPRTAKTEREKSLRMLWKQALGVLVERALGTQGNIILHGSLAWCDYKYFHICFSLQQKHTLRGLLRNRQ